MAWIETSAERSVAGHPSVERPGRSCSLTPRINEHLVGQRGSPMPGQQDRTRGEGEKRRRALLQGVACLEVIKNSYLKCITMRRRTEQEAGARAGTGAGDRSRGMRQAQRQEKEANKKPAARKA